MDQHTRRSWPSAPKLGRSRARSDHDRPKSTGVEPELAAFEPALVDFEPRPADFGPELADIEPQLADIRPKVAAVAQNWSISSENGRTSPICRIRARIHQHRPSQLILRPNSPERCYLSRRRPEARARKSGPAGHLPTASAVHLGAPPEMLWTGPASYTPSLTHAMWLLAGAFAKP